MSKLDKNTACPDDMAHEILEDRIKGLKIVQRRKYRNNQSKFVRTNPNNEKFDMDIIENALKHHPSNLERMTDST